MSVMEQRSLIPEFSLPVLGFGTSKPFSAAEAAYYLDRDSRIREIRMAIDKGLTYIDTASRYGEGQVEELVGEAIAPYDRAKLLISSKLRGDRCRYRRVFVEVEESLRRLRTPYLDLYLVHSPSLSVPIEETMRAFNELVDQGKVRHIGVSNFSVAQLETARSSARYPIVSNQIEYNLMTRNHGVRTEYMESEIIPYCQKNGILVVAYRPLAGGVLPLLGDEFLGGLARKYQKTPSQIAINWLIGKPGIVTLVKSRKAEHLDENLAALGWELAAADREYLDGLFFLH